MTDGQRHNASTIMREFLLSGTFDAHIDRIEAHRIELPPAQKAGRHYHPGGVVGYVLDGEIAFEIAGQPVALLRSGHVFYEPPGATITRFDNVSDADPAVFVAFYPLSGDQPLISFADDQV